MRAAGILLALFIPLLSLPASAGQDSGRLLDVLPAEGLEKASVLVFREQASLDAHYFLADENVLGLDGRPEAVFARYLMGRGEALLLVVSYASEEEAGRAYERFGRDFFSKRFNPRLPRVLEELESGYCAGAVRTRAFLIVVLEAPDRKSCEELIRRAEEKTRALF